MLSQFMMIAQDDIREFKSNKNDWLLKAEEIKLYADTHDKNLRE